MRAALLTLFCLCLGCTLVVDGRIDEYEGACSDEEEALAAEYGRPDNRRNLEEIVEDCRGCIGEDCVEECVHEDTGAAVSIECAACFADAGDCVQRFCPERCGGDRNPGDCLLCSCNFQCTQELNACAGYTVVPCPSPL